MSLSQQPHDLTFGHVFSRPSAVGGGSLHYTPYGIGSTLLVPVNSRIWEQSAHGTIISIDLIGEASKWLITEDNALREYDSVVLYHNNMYREFEFSSRNCIMPHLEEHGKVILYPSILRDGKKTARTSVVLYLEEELNR